MLLIHLFIVNCVIQKLKKCAGVMELSVNASIVLRVLLCKRCWTLERDAKRASERRLERRRNGRRGSRHSGRETQRTRRQGKKRESLTRLQRDANESEQQTSNTSQALKLVLRATSAALAHMESGFQVHASARRTRWASSAFSATHSST